MAPRYKLKLSKLDFVSLVDVPAQETATVRLIKRGDGDEVQATMTGRVLKIGDGDSPLAYFWAFTCTGEDGKPYHDLQGDAVDSDFTKVAEEFMARAAAVDEMHDSNQTNRIAFAFPMDGSIATAMLGPEAGAATKTSGLMIAIRPTPEALAKLRDGTYTGVSIAGTGVREVVKAVWSTADKDSLPDASFLYIEGGGTKDTDGKTTPRNLRHFPYRDGAGKIDLAHLRAAISDIPKSSIPMELRNKLQVKAEKLLAAQHDIGKAAMKPKTKKKPVPPAAGDNSGDAAQSYKRVGKMAALTSVTDGHQHSVDLDDPADCWRDMLSTSYQTMDGATESHSHAWVYDGITGKITVALDSGHTHTIDSAVPPAVIAEAAEPDEEDEPSCVPCAVEDEKSSGAVVVTVVAARAPDSSPASGTPTVKSQEQVMPTEQETQIASLRKMLTASLALSEPMRLHLAKQAPADVEAFLAMDSASRDGVLKAAMDADPVVLKTASGLEIRKSDGPVAKMLAEQADAQAAIVKSQAEQLAISKAAAEQASFEKRATVDLSHFAKGITVRAAIVKALDGISDEALRKEANEAIKGANFAMAKLGKPDGADDHAGPADVNPEAALNKMATDHAAVAKISFAKAYDAILQTPEGTTLYNQLNTPVMRAV